VPFLRVIRDKRGYETTYLMDWYREGTRQRSRILYVFRTPGGVRVGRTSLEPEVLRQIEAQYPAVAFDWKAVLDTRHVIDAAPDHRRTPARRRAEGDDAAAPVAAPAEGAAQAEAVQAPPGRPALPSTIEGATPEERTTFLARWYPIVRDRVAQRMTDPVRREALMALAERLNPSPWTNPEEVDAGLLQAAEALERLSRVLTRRRRRSGRGTTNPVPPASESRGSDPADDTPEADAQSADQPPASED